VGFAVIAPLLPLRANMFGLRLGGDRALRGLSGRFDGSKAPVTMSSVCEGRLWSGSKGPKDF